MSLTIAGAGWVTPLGSDIATVWQQLLNGEAARVETITSDASKNSYPVFRVPDTVLEALPRNPRLRRASAISRFAALAGLSALADARSTIGEIDLKRTAVIFAVANGGVIYTKRFYDDIVTIGAQSASPLLFPETVFNAPASHLAAILGIEGASYTVVGDGAVGILAINMAAELLASRNYDCCLVVATEEADWLLCDAYHKWRLVRRTPPIEPYARQAKGTMLSEGAGAALLTIGNGRFEIRAIHRGGYFSSRRAAKTLLDQIVKEIVGPDTEAVVTSANGTFVDNLEMQSLGGASAKPVRYSLKPALGESVGASALWQLIAAMQMIQSNQIPRMLHLPGSRAVELMGGSIGVLSCGLNQQAAGLQVGKYRA